MKAYKVTIEKNDPSENARNWGDEYFIVFGNSFEEAGKEAQFLISKGSITAISYFGDCLPGGSGRPIKIQGRI